VEGNGNAPIPAACKTAVLRLSLPLEESECPGQELPHLIVRSQLLYRGFPVCGSVRAKRRYLVKDQNRSLQITHVSQGRLEVEGNAEPYKDAKLFPGGSREWN